MNKGLSTTAGAATRKAELSAQNKFLLTTEEAAALLAIAAATLTKWRSTGENGIPFIKIGRAARYRREDLVEFANRNVQGGQQ